MIDLTGVEHHPAIDEIVAVLCNKTQNTDRGFFQVEAAYFLCKIASSMRATVITKDRGAVPINAYALALATSGFGKGYSMSVMENEFLKPFQRRFVDDTMPEIADTHLWSIANNRAAKNGTDQQEEFDKALKDYKECGAFPFTFDSGTPPAVKQLRTKLLLGGSGSVNLQIDEIGSNLIGSTDVLNLFLELFDLGLVKQKLVKNTAENKRSEEIEGRTPTNMLLFGTPAKLFDGGQTEDQFYSFLETGYARRCLFGHGKHVHRASATQSAEEMFRRLTEPNNSETINRWSSHFHKLADSAFFDWKIQVPDNVAIRLLEYKIACETLSDGLPEHEEVRKAELSHRYFKALKLAGAYAFIDESEELEMSHMMSAIRLVEESGKSFQEILNREKTYVKLAKYIAAVNGDVTHADLVEALPFYKNGTSARNEMMALATAWGYRQHIIIKKKYTDTIEFFSGETLEETDLSKIRISYSNHWAFNYGAEEVPFDQLHNLSQAEDMHWCNHFFRKDHRAEENVIDGFNIIVIDVDGGVDINLVHELMKDYKHFTYTTKSHTDDSHRFRLVLPINYILELDTEEYKDFMNSFMEWLPFKSDETANQRAKKWETCSTGTYHYNLEGEILDALPFIPRTSRNEDYKRQTKNLESLDNLERWFAQKITSGNRNNHMIKYALALVDSGMTLVDVSKQVHDFNRKLNNPLSEDEIDSTIMVTVAKRFQKTN